MSIYLNNTTFQDERSFQLLRLPLVPLSYSDGAVIYAHGNEVLVDTLPFTPLFALSPVQRAVLAHYQITCPYCGHAAPLVGGCPTEGYYFVCEDRCHHAFSRFIRRY